MNRPARTRTIGTVTRGTTNTNRLRRVDRWIAAQPALRGARDPLVVDLGYGASGVTVFELESRLRRARRHTRHGRVRVLGLEIDPDRAERASAQLKDVRDGVTQFRSDAHVSFARGGFEVPTPRGEPATVIRAFNVLRQYDESEVLDAWRLMSARLRPGGFVVEGTCDELGRVCSWVTLSPDGPVTLTVSLRLRELERPSIVAERLPKALIHRNVPGERVHGFLSALDAAWSHSAALSPYGPVQRWIGTIEHMRDDCWPGGGWRVLGDRSRWRLGEVSLPWSHVAPG
ncbi:class I SAM-dependent methyltransferase [Rathayibacter sp. KR2-224]|uniref:class I SAM-dependent methyltransferase n=1 Tax=Rathayibacter sp. KR2-224 TaxID=3400913 RepID=UPI003C08DD09